jgi:hypothetical protein
VSITINDEHWLCHLFGHRLPTGSGSGRPYLRQRGGPVDGMGTHHVRLLGECPRCGKEWHIANIHDISSDEVARHRRLLTETAATLQQAETRIMTMLDEGKRR